MMITTQMHFTCQIQGLTEVHAGPGIDATLVFDGFTNADAARKNIALIASCASAFLKHYQQLPNMDLVDLLEVYVHSESKTLHFSTKLGGTVGKPIETVEELLTKLGKALMSPSLPERTYTVIQH